MRTLTTARSSSRAAAAQRRRRGDDTLADPLRDPLDRHVLADPLARELRRDALPARAVRRDAIQRTSDSEADDESEKGASKRKKQLRKKGYNVDNSTNASGFVVKKRGNPTPKKRNFRPGKTRRTEQALRQITSSMLAEYPKGVEIQSLYVPSRKILFFASNKAEVNKQILKDIQSSPTFAKFLGGLVTKHEIKDPGFTKTKKKRKIPKTQQDQPVKRRSAKMKQALRLSPEHNERKRGKETAELFEQVKRIKKEDVEEFKPSDTTFDDGKLYFLKDNLLVEGNDKVQEHAEVNFFPVIDFLGLKKGEYTLAGPKIECATCKQKGIKKNVFEEGESGRLFPGQIPLEKDGGYKEEFLDEVTTRGEKKGYVASSNFQYADSESDYEIEEAYKGKLVFDAELQDGTKGKCEGDLTLTEWNSVVTGQATCTCGKPLDSTFTKGIDARVVGSTSDGKGTVMFAAGLDGSAAWAGTTKKNTLTASFQDTVKDEKSAAVKVKGKLDVKK